MPSTSTTQRTSASGVARSFFSSLLAAVLTPASPSRRWPAVTPGRSTAAGSAVPVSHDRSASSCPARGPSSSVAITPPMPARTLATRRRAQGDVAPAAEEARHRHPLGNVLAQMPLVELRLTSRRHVVPEREDTRARDGHGADGNGPEGLASRVGYGPSALN